MAAVTKDPNASISTLAPSFNSRFSGLVAGENLAACDPVYIDNQTGKLFKARADVAETRRVAGFTVQAAMAGEPITIAWDVRFEYGLGVGSLVPGTPLYLSNTVAGGFDTTAHANAPTPIAFVINDRLIEVHRNIFALSGV